MRNIASALALLAMTSACAGGSAVPTGTRASTPPQTSFRTPQISQDADTSGIVGQAVPALARRFGTARIDLAEGDARKLQFASDNCVLDIYLYPLSANGTPVATHIETRLRKDGRAVENASCIAEVERVARAR